MFSVFKCRNNAELSELEPAYNTYSNLMLSGNTVNKRSSIIDGQIKITFYDPDGYITPINTVTPFF